MALQVPSEWMEKEHRSIARGSSFDSVDKVERVGMLILGKTRYPCKICVGDNADEG